MEKSKVMSGYEKIYDDGYKAGRAAVVLPHPCDGPLYEDWLWPQYLDKMREEFEEVVEAVKSVRDCTKKHLGVAVHRERCEHLMRECTDLIVATTTFMYRTGYNESDRQRLMFEVNERNAKRDGGRRFANEELPASALAFPVFKDSEKSDPMKNTECLLPEYLDEYFRDKKIDGETVTLLRGEKYGKIAVRVGAELYYVSYGPMKNWSCEENEND